MTTLDIKQLLGKRIKELRIKRNLTQEYLAEQIGIGQRSLSRIECGNSFVTAETLSKLLEILNIEARELFDYNHKKDKECLKEELIRAIMQETIDIEVLYKFYTSLK